MYGLNVWGVFLVVHAFLALAWYLFMRSHSAVVMGTASIICIFSIGQEFIFTNFKLESLPLRILVMKWMKLRRNPWCTSENFAITQNDLCYQYVIEEMILFVYLDIIIPYHTTDQMLSLFENIYHKELMYVVHSYQNPWNPYLWITYEVVVMLASMLVFSCVIHFKSGTLPFSSHY